MAHLFKELARKLLAGTASMRKPASAVDLARRAVELAPDRAPCHHTLGVALYRAGRYSDSVPSLEKSFAMGKDQADAFDLFFLAMARHELGQTARARDDLDRAIRWVQSHPQLPGKWTAELGELRAEAEAILANELPARVFTPGAPGIGSQPR